MIDARMDALREMLECFYASVPESRLAAYARKLREVPDEIVKRVCVRAIENSDRCPSLASLLAQGRQLVQEQRREEHPEGGVALECLFPKDFEAIRQARHWCYSEREVLDMCEGLKTWPTGPRVISARMERLFRKAERQLDCEDTREWIVEGSTAPPAAEMDSVGDALEELF